MNANFTLVDHPLIQHKLTILRRKDTATAQFRQVLREVAFVLGCEVTKELTLGNITIETPLEKTEAPYLSGKKVCFVSILRAGNGLLDGLLDLVPSARVGHIGMYRDHETLQPTKYYYKTPGQLDSRLVVIVDPMLATGNTAIEAANLLKSNGANNLKFLCLVAAPEGVDSFTKAHSDIPIIAAGLDRELNDIGYIMPGLGDAGDRMYGTKA